MPSANISDDILEKHPWPAPLSAYLAQALDNAGIPYVFWGDLVFGWYGAPVCPAVCIFHFSRRILALICLKLSAYVVSRDDVERAEVAINEAGMFPHYCDCRAFLHHTDPKNSMSIKNHWFLQRQRSYVTILSNEDTFHSLIPITLVDPNPLHLEVLLVNQAISSVKTKLDPAVTSHTLRFLSRLSLVKLQLVLIVSQVKPRGILVPWFTTLGYVSRLERDVILKGLDEDLRSMYQGLLSGRYEGIQENFEIAKSSASFQVSSQLSNFFGVSKLIVK